MRNDQTGDLTEASGSPFTNLHSMKCMMQVVDPKGRFGYGPCGLGTTMYTINATTGEVDEVGGSPFGASTDTRLGYVAAESTGQYVYVLKVSLSDIYPTPSTVLLDTLPVDSTNEQLVALGSQSIPLSGTLVAASASEHGFYLLINQNQNEPYPVAALYAILFDPTSGQASAPQSLLGLSSNALALMLDSAGKNLVVSAGESCGSLWFFQLSASDGTVSNYQSSFLACEEFAAPLAFDPTSTFFYAQYSGTGVTETGIRIIEVATATETASSPVPASVEAAIGGQADPQGPFWFLAGPAPSGGIVLYGVDPGTGYPVPPAAFSNPLFPGRNLTIGPATTDVNTHL